MDDNLNLYMLVSLTLRLITLIFLGVVGVVFSQNASLEERMFFDLESNSAISLDKLAGRLLVTNFSNADSST